MGLTKQSTGLLAMGEDLKFPKNSEDEKIIALGGNPNVGKSTVFNNLTGLKQHTGNWPGKTVTNAAGRFACRGKQFILVDIPGTYSLMANSEEEEVARDFLCFSNHDAAVIVVDATCLERNLNLVFQTAEITDKVIVCVNLLDEAERKGIEVDLKKLSLLLGVPVVGTSAATGKGLNRLTDIIHDVACEKVIPMPKKIIYNEQIEGAIAIIAPTLKERFTGKISERWLALKLLENDDSLIKAINKYLNTDLSSDGEIMAKLNEGREFLSSRGIDSELLRDNVVSSIIKESEKICTEAVSFTNEKYDSSDRRIDKILTSKRFGIPIMIALLGIVFWLTITGANYPSQVLSKALFYLQNKLTWLFNYIGAPKWLEGVLVQGMYKTLAWVVAVMLPPMAIFFPIFTLLEDLGYLPRIAFNLDNFFKKSCACGKQALTMCMGFGCNAAGIIGCRIIDSPRERLIAIITNNFAPCNGRFPILIAMITIFFTPFFTGPFKSVISAMLLVGVIVLGVFMSLMMSKLLSKTILKGMPSSFTLELPPYRKPQIGKVIVRSIVDRTLFVLGRAASVAAPAGILIWIMANITVGHMTLMAHCAEFLNPFARAIGLDGYILMAFILGFPANEIVVPIIIMSYTASSSITELESFVQLRELLVQNGWTWLTALCVMLFSLMHWPCSTTCLTIKKETQSMKWTAISFLVPTVTGIVICFVITSVVRLLGFAV
ncbi:MAG: ferrous iron transport protein B [Clostridia bacterium]|nr:ferrous iron transport protein B [Clostridia bacterium]